MSKVNETIFLLILDHSENNAEKTISLLRNAGIPTRAKRILTEEELLDALKEQAWDLFIAREKQAEFDINQALAHIKQSDRDLPSIILSQAYDPDVTVNHMKAGAKDVIPSENEAHLVVAVRRELGARADRKALRNLDVLIRDVEHRCELLLDSSKDAIAYVSDGMHIYANSSYMQFLGYDDIDELICIPVLDTMDTESQATFKEQSKPFSDPSYNECSETVPCTSIRENGTEIKANMSLSAATYDGESCLQIIIRPEHDSEELAEKIKELSQQDLLTGLYNRQYFMEKLSEVKEQAINNNSNSAVLYLAIDQFQKIKTEHGIADADLVLRDLAQVLESKLEDGHTLARLSDDVFGIISSAQEGETAIKIGEYYGNLVEEHLFEVNAQTVQLSVSIGVTLVTENAPVVNDILGRAQTASQELAKEENASEINGVKLYAPKNDKPLDDITEATHILQDALDHDKFKLLFQPIINLRGESKEHYEAFIRLINDEGEEISPYDFLPPGGPSQTANKIDKWVILQTIKHLGAHRSKGHDTQLFINLTAETLQDQTFTSWLNVALKAARLPGDSLIFQISENNAITYLKQVKEFAKGISTLHCRLSINQFGRALKPFNLLKHIEPDYIKLEGSFTKDMQADEDTREAAKEMITELQAMGKQTIVPLVESASMLSVLWQAGVNYIQGYYLQAPSTEMNYDFSEE